MRFTRRSFLVSVGGIVAATGAFLADLLPFRIRTARGQISWSVRRATYDDLGVLRDIFNAQREAGLFPFSELIEPWTAEKAGRMLDTYTGTLVLELNGQAVGFGALIDYTAAETQSSIAPDADPEVKILAIRVDQLDRTQRTEATKQLALAISRDLQRQGFSSCEATIHARTGFQNLFTEQMDVTDVNERDGVAEAKQVSFRIDEVVEKLELEGL